MPLALYLLYVSKEVALFYLNILVVGDIRLCYYLGEGRRLVEGYILR